jgi:RND family efflux transporter MFP subunit
MIEFILIYVLICYILLKKGIVKKTTKNYATMIIIGVVVLYTVFVAFRYYAFLDLTSTATVKSTNIAVRTPTGGEIDKIYVTSNQRVKKGDILFTIDTSKYTAQYEQIEADIRAQENNVENLEKTFKRNQDLKAKGYISQSDFDQSLTNLKNQKENLIKSRGVLDNLLWILDRSTVISPIDGVTNIIYISEGQYLPENRIGLFTIFSDDKFLEVRIPDQLYSFIKPGNFAEFYVNTHPGKIFRGRVASISQSTGEAQATSGTTILNAQATSSLVRNGQSIGRIAIIEFVEPEGINIPIGSNGMVWVSVEKPNHLIAFLDIIAGLILRTNAIEAYLKAL